MIEKTKLHLGCGRDIMPDYINVDITPHAGVDVTFDLESCAEGKQLPFHDNHFEEIFCAHTLEHIHNILPLMEELHRVAKHECVFFIRVPYGGTASAFDDPTHCRMFYPTSFLYFGQPAYWRADYGYRGDWQVEEVALLIHPAIHERLVTTGISPEFAVHHLHNVVHEMLAVMIAQKPARPADPKLQPEVKPVIELINPDGTIPGTTDNN